MDAESNSIVALVDAAGRVDRVVIGAWVAAGGPARELGFSAPVTQLDLEPERIAERLAIRSDDPLVLPVRVLWQPAERDGVRRTTFTDLAVGNNPRKPNLLWQRHIARTAPDRHQILVGIPARLSELRARHVRDRGHTDPQSLARSIARAAVVTLERAERAVIGDRYKIPRLVAEEILDSPTLRGRLDEIATETGLTGGQAYRRAERSLRGLVAGQSRLVTDLFSQAMRPFYAGAWKIDADTTGLDQLRRLNKRHPLVFLPSHRSYVDAFVLGDVLARNDFPPNHLIGGANLAFWPVGPVARRTGAVFIRRNFGDDEIYKAVVEEYFAYLLSRRFNMEWYFEGGRTRTGKLRPPRYGLLNYLAAAVRNRRVHDVMLVPVSITYERLNELGALADEQTGGAKKPEDMAWLARYLRNQRHNAGNVYVRFGEAISARDRLSAHGDSPDQPTDSETRRYSVQRLAFEVAVAINRVTPITVNALVTLALLGVHERALTVAEVRAVVEPVLGYLQQRDLLGELSTLRRQQELTVVLEQLTVAKVLGCYRGGLEPVYSINTGQHLIAAFYRNSAVHWFVNRSVLELAVLGAGEAGYPALLQSDWSMALRLRDLLKFEFFFPSRTEFEQELAREMLLIDPQWPNRELSYTELLDKLADSGFFMVHRTLRSFFDAQLVVAERLAARAPDEVIDDRDFIAECVAVGKQMLLQDRLHSTESVSTELFTTAIKLAANLELVEPGAEELAQRRSDYVAELRTIGTLISRAAALDVSNRRGLWDAN